MSGLDIKWLVPTILFAITAIATVWQYLIKDCLNARKQAKEGQRKALHVVRRALRELLGKVSNGQSLVMYVERTGDEYSDPSHFADQQSANPLLPRRIRFKLNKLAELKREYARWRDEAVFVLDSVVRKEVERREKLKAYWDYLVRRHQVIPLETVLCNKFYPPLLVGGTLELQEAKKVILEHYGPDYAVPFPLPGTVVQESEPPPEVAKLESIHTEPLIKLREHILDTREFHRLIEELGKAGSRPTVERVRSIRRELEHALQALLRLIGEK